MLCITPKVSKGTCNETERKTTIDFDELLKSAVLTGLKPCEFEELTPRQYIIYIEQIIEQKETENNNEIDLCIINAYYSAAFRRAKKMPKLQTVLTKIKQRAAKKKQSEEEMINIVKTLNAAFGGKVVK